MCSRLPSAHQVRVIAAIAIVDPRTVRRFFAGEHMKGTTYARVEDAVARLGFSHLLVDAPSDPDLHRSEVS